MFSIPRDRPIDLATLEVLRCVDRVALELTIEYFVVGAMARDILLTGIFGLKTGQATRDVDLGIVVQGWKQFEAVKAHLISTGDFTGDAKRVQRLYHHNPKGASYPLDLIPFGGIEQHPNKIVWPPDGSEILNVAGYGEALSFAVLVEVEPGFIIRVASLPGLAIMKLLAWADRGAADRRDATDLATLLHRYADAGNEDRLFGAEIQVLEKTNYDLDLAGARLLGVDAGRIASPDTRSLILKLLNDPLRLEQLGLDISRELRAAADPVLWADKLLGEFKLGFSEA